MSLRTRFRRWRIGGARYDRAVTALAATEPAERRGREAAEAFVRKLHAEYPNPTRRCTLSRCCSHQETADG